MFPRRDAAKRSGKLLPRPSVVAAAVSGRRFPPEETVRRTAERLVPANEVGGSNVLCGEAAPRTVAEAMGTKRTSVSAVLYGRDWSRPLVMS